MLRRWQRIRGQAQSPRRALGSPAYTLAARASGAAPGARLGLELLHDLKEVVVHALVVLELLLDVPEVRQGIVSRELLGGRATAPLDPIPAGAGRAHVSALRTMGPARGDAGWATGKPFSPLAGAPHHLCMRPLRHSRRRSERARLRDQGVDSRRFQAEHHSGRLQSFPGARGGGGAVEPAGRPPHLAGPLKRGVRAAPRASVTRESGERERSVRGFEGRKIPRICPEGREERRREGKGAAR